MVSLLKSMLREIIPDVAWQALHKKRVEIEQWLKRRKRLRRRAQRAIASQPMIRIGNFSNFFVAYRIETADENVIAQSFENDFYFPAIQNYALPKNAVILDVGAHIGAFALRAAQLAPEGKIFAVEASRETSELARINAALNKKDNIIIDHLALSDKSGSITLYYDPDGNWGNSTVHNFSSSSEQVEATTLESYLKSRNIDKVDLAKFNCEGAEFPILIGAPIDTLQKLKKAIVLYHCDLAGKEWLPQLLAKLKEAGHEVEFKHTEAARGWLIATRSEITL